MYERKIGFFGSVKALGTNTVKGVDLVVNDTIGITVDLTGATRIVSSVAKSAINIWGEDLLEDLESDRAINRIHREIGQIQQQAEIDSLRVELAKAKKPVGRPRKATKQTTEA